MSAPTRLGIASALLIAGGAVATVVPASLLVRTITATVLWLFAILYAVGVEGDAPWRGAALAVACLAGAAAIAAWVVFVLSL